MPQVRDMIKVVEGVTASNKALKGLAVTVSFQEGESVQSEFYPVKEALLDWHGLYGEACGALELEYLADEPLWQEIEDFWMAKLEADQFTRSLFEAVGNVELWLTTQAGRNIKKIGFELGKK